MDTLFLIAAGLGGGLIACQFVMSLLGVGSDGHDLGGHDLHGDAESGEDPSSTADWFFGFLTFRALSAALTFFGLGGLCAGYYGLPQSAQLATGTLAGLGALYLVATLMRWLYRLKADGTVRMDRAVGRTGTVYLRVPGMNSGVGKVTLNLQNRTVEVEAFTAADELPTGTPVQVVAMRGTNCVEVAAIVAATGGVA
jgi:membrane protein implicated in regulation of membrane protease activity